MKNLSKIKLFFMVLLSVSGLNGCATTLDLSHQTPALKQPEFLALPKNKTTKRLPCDKPATINCPLLKLTAITFLPHETILSIHAGDSAHWLFSSMISHTDSLPLQHLLIKPKENPSQTNAIIATNQRTYYLNLFAQDCQQMPIPIAFEDKNAELTPSTRCVDTHYKMRKSRFQGRILWQPTAVYNDGSSVYIDMANLSYCTAPVLYLLDESGHAMVVNYTINKNSYRVNQLFHQALLVSGVGRQQQRITLEYTG